MKAGIYITAAAVGLCAAGAVALYYRHRRTHVQPVPKTETVEDRFISEWANILKDNARVFNGLFGGMHRVVSGTAKKPEKVLREWCQRAHYKWENEPVDNLCQQNIVPLIEAADRDALTKWANLLLDAAAAAGITREEAASLVLTEHNSEAYIEWDGCELYPEDEVEVITPAWYQNGKILEQGQCRKATKAEE